MVFLDEPKILSFKIFSSISIFYFMASVLCCWCGGGWGVTHGRFLPGTKRPVSCFWMPGCSAWLASDGSFCSCPSWEQRWWVQWLDSTRAHEKSGLSSQLSASAPAEATAGTCGVKWYIGALCLCLSNTWMKVFKRIIFWHWEGFPVLFCFSHLDGCMYTPPGNDLSGWCEGSGFTSCHVSVWCQIFLHTAFLCLCRNQ